VENWTIANYNSERNRLRFYFPARRHCDFWQIDFSPDVNRPSLCGVRRHASNEERLLAALAQWRSVSAPFSIRLLPVFSPFFTVFAVFEKRTGSMG
jgi:hypothetical protein